MSRKLVVFFWASGAALACALITLWVLRQHATPWLYVVAMCSLVFSFMAMIAYALYSAEKRLQISMKSSAVLLFAAGLASIVTAVVVAELTLLLVEPTTTYSFGGLSRTAETALFFVSFGPLPKALGYLCFASIFAITMEIFYRRNSKLLATFAAVIAAFGLAAALLLSLVTA
jgi:hypothetical protein